MKLHAVIDNEQHEIDFKKADNRLDVEIGGRLYELEASEVEPYVYLLKYENRIYQIYVSTDSAVQSTFKVTSGNNGFEINILDPKRLRNAGNAGAAAGGAAEIKTAMPGKIVRVLVEQGAEIKQGEGVIIVEAMKMQNEMKAPKDGVIKEIRFAEGTTVNAGDVLVIIE